jgi:predicted Zn finger-like uncharacterized protein
MDITCNRCKTEYDFDDALVSDRGTTVRCTNCGDQFKVYRAGSSPAPERWIVHGRDGRELVFTDVRDLQRAITHGEVRRDDTLSRGAAPPRQLGAIAELEPLFGPAPAPTPTERELAAGPLSSGHAPAGPDPLPARTGRTGRPPPHGSAVPPPAGFRNAHPPETGLSAGIGSGAYADVNAATAYEPMTNRSPGTSPYASSSAGSLGAAPQVRAENHAFDEPSSSDDPLHDWQNEPRFSVPSMRSRALRWAVVLVVLGMLGVAGATVGRKYLAGAMRPAPASQGNEGRVDKLLEDGNRALSEGDLETAKESFAKASALAERDPRVLLDLARLDAARADTDWLKARLLSDQPDVLAAGKRQAQQSADRALRAADRAAEVLPDDPKVARAKIDALRLSGNLLGARALVVKVGAIAAQPETGYVLAALDLAEPSPSWPAVLDRLKAAAGESNLGRARAALAYALVRSGDMIGARAELEKMSAATHPYPLLPELRALVGRAPATTATEVDAGKRAAPAAAPAEPRAGEAARSEGDAPPAGDYRSLIQRATQASSGGDYAKAEALFRAALTKSPGDTEALAGLGDVARARGNATLARSYYERVLAQNPHYLPALTALADLRWAAGDRQGAAKLYRQLLDSAPEGPLTQRARDHIAQVEAGSASKPTKPASPDRAPAPAPATNAPEIDTSDLPGFKR